MLPISNNIYCCILYIAYRDWARKDIKHKVVYSLIVVLVALYIAPGLGAIGVAVAQNCDLCLGHFMPVQFVNI